MRTLKDRYGFLFWLRWILWFAGSFIVAAVLWTALMRFLFGRIAGEELTITWTISVFGSWFLLVIPFMRKKEQIWKRLNDDQEKAVDAWFMGMGTFIGFLVLSAFIWSVVFKDRIGPDPKGFDPLWVKAVLGSWLIILVPFLILMYRKADKIFSTAVERQTYVPKFKTVAVDPVKRTLPEQWALELKGSPPTLPKGHLVRLALKDGREIPHVFVVNAREILGVYDREIFDFEAKDIVKIEVMARKELLPYDETKWLRLDGCI